MNEYTREIDLLDLFIDWLAHWKSFFVFLLVGVICAMTYMYVGGTTTSTSVSEEDVISEVADDVTLSTLTSEQLSALTLKDMENDFLSEKDITAVDELIALSEEYSENLQVYDSQKEKLELKDRSEAFNYIANTKNIIEARKAALTADQQIYYYAKTGVSIVVGQANELDGEEEKTATDVVVETSPSKSKALLIVIVFAFIHFVWFACRYIFDNTVKHTDNLSLLTEVPEYTRMVDWDCINAKKGIDKLVYNMRFAGIRRTSLSDTIEINASATIEKMKNKSYSSIAIVGSEAAELGKKLSEQITKADTSKVVKSIDSITHSVNGADEIAGVDAAILAVKVRKTRYNELLEELQSLKDRDVDVVGIAVFE